MRALPILSCQTVRVALAALLRQGDATLVSTACRLKISSRSLQRHLGQMGTSHSELLAEVRMDIACRLLRHSSKRLSDIAKCIGYANASSFSRSFARLMKIQPNVYRRQQFAGKHKGKRVGRGLAN